MADPNRLDTESMPMTEPYKPTFDTGVHPKAEPELIEPEPPARRRRWWRRRSDPTPTEAPAEVPVTDDVPAVDLYPDRGHGSSHHCGDLAQPLGGKGLQ